MSLTPPFRLPEATGPLPVSAVFDASETAAYITFDRQLLLPGPAAATTFTMHQPERRYQAGAVTRPLGNVIRVAAVNPTLVTAAMPVIDYNGAMNTVVAADPPGLPAASFTGLPCPEQ